MTYLLKAATILSLDPPSVEPGDLRIDGGTIIERASKIEPLAGEEVIDLSGKVVMPGMICGHTHLYSALARGMPAPPRIPTNFPEILELIWWRLDRALDEETIYWSAVAGAMDAARAGTTCLFDHHASPSHVRGSLEIVREAIEKVGLRAVLCYETTDRGGATERNDGIEENRAFLNRVKQSLEASGGKESDGESSEKLFRAMVGAHASFTLSDESLEMCAEAMREFNAGLHIHAAEDLCDVEDARNRFGLGVIERLEKRGAINSKTILAHGIHLSDRDIEIARNAGAWFAHNPSSNMNNQVGYAPVSKFGERVLLGTDGIGADMFEEARVAYFKSRDGRAGVGADYWTRALANNQRLASEMFGADLTSLSKGSIADLIILDYDPPTPLTAENLAWHMAFGMRAAFVESVIVGGRFVIRNRRHALKEEVYENARRASEKLWSKLRA